MDKQAMLNRLNFLIAEEMFFGGNLFSNSAPIALAA